MIELLSGASAIPIALAAIFAAIVLHAIGRDRVRRRRLEAVAARLGLVYQGRGEGVVGLLSGLPSMERTDRHLFLHVLRGPDELLADWVVVAKPKQHRRRRRARTLYARRRPAVDASPSRVEGIDPRPDGIGRHAIECAGEWSVCIALDRRLEPEALPGFREQAIEWIEAFEARA